MEQVEMNNMCINIDANNGSEKCTEKTLRLINMFVLCGKMQKGLILQQLVHAVRTGNQWLKRGTVINAKHKIL